ncbi:hypothetical protein [Bradyrhizobium genosp. A]|uniref:hypothetical protein n=1 Tax=Bradyrhizobium genosp. A TaxID=83626 RepID=UPI003CF61E6B
MASSKFWFSPHGAIRSGLFHFDIGFDTSGKTPAEWHHRNEFVRPAREASAAGFFVSIAGIGRRPAHRGLALVETRSWSADKRAAVRTTLLAEHARTCRPAARAFACAAAVSGDGDKVRAETIARRLAICRIVVFVGEKMTVYLISLALAGLVAIVVWEIFA